MGIFNEQSFDHPFAKGIQGAPGVGFRLTADGNYDITGKKLTNVGAPTANNHAATKKYVDDNTSSHTSSGLTVNSNIDMKDRYRILNLKSPSDADEPATKQYSDSKFLDRDGSKTMTGNLSMNNNKIISLKSPSNNNDAATKKYVDDKTFLALDGSKKMTGNLDMNNKKIVNVASATSDKDAVNIDYLNNNVLLLSGTSAMAGSLQMNNYLITGMNVKPVNSQDATSKHYCDTKYYARDGSVSLTADLNIAGHRIRNLRTPLENSEVSTKKYVDDSVSPYFKKDGTVTMTGNLKMGNNKITGLKSPTASTDATTKKYVDDNITNSRPDLSDYLEKDGTVTMTGSLKMGNNKIVGLATPTLATDAATKKYVDDKPSGSGDFKKDGSVAMTGNLNMGNNRIISLADPINSSDSTNMSWVKNQIQHFNVLSSPVFSISTAPAYSTIYLQYQSNRFVFTTSRPGQSLISWKPSSGTYINKIVFNFNRSINVKKVSFVARDSRISNVDFWVSGSHTGLFTLNIHRTWNYEMSGVFMDYTSDANSNHPPITANIYTGKPSAVTRDFKKITFNSPTEFTSTVTAQSPTASTQVATKDYVDKSVAGPAHYKNVFDYIMESAAQWTDEITTRTSFVIDRFGDLSTNNGNFHSYNLRVAFFKLKKYSAGYKFKIGLNFYRLAASDYTICLEFLNPDYRLWHKTQISVDHQSSSGLTFHSESIKKLTHTYYYPTSNIKIMYYHRVIVSFTKNNSGRSFFHITINMPEVGGDMASYPTDFTTFYGIVYGINGAVGNIDPDRSYDYHTAFDVQPSQVTYNVGINMNNKAITNLSPDQNTNSAATFGAVRELRNSIPGYFYQNLFEEVWDFKMGDKYVLAPSSRRGLYFNKLKSLKGTSDISFSTSKSINELLDYGLDISNLTLTFTLPDNYSNLNLFLIFKFWTNRTFHLIRKDSLSIKRFGEASYDKHSKKLLIKSGMQTSISNFPINVTGKKLVLHFKQTGNSSLYVQLNDSATYRAIGSGSISNKQTIQFYSESATLYKVMYTSNMNVDNKKIVIQEFLTDN